MPQRSIKLLLVTGFLLGAWGRGLAQSDTIAATGVTIVSSFRPVLRQSPKLNFSAAPLASDTTRVVLPYRILSRQLLFDNTVRSVQPLAYTIDTARSFPARSFVEAGYGNLRNPTLRMAINKGNGVTSGFSLGGKYASITQRPEARDMRFYQVASLKADGYRQLKGVPLQLSSSLGFTKEITRNNINYDTARSVASFLPDSLRQRFSLWSAHVLLRSTAPMASGISIFPGLRFYRFSDQRKNTETNMQLQAPLQKQIGTDWWVHTVLSLQTIRYAYVKRLSSPMGLADSISQNSLLSFTTAIRYQQSSFQVQAGVAPTWNHGNFAVLPQLSLSYALPGNESLLMAGWNGRWIQNSYRELAALNPWMWAPAPLRASRLTERYVGLKGQVNEKLAFDVRAFFNTTESQPLFLNDTTRKPSSGFVVVYEDRLQQLQLNGSLSYKVAENFSVTSQLLINRFIKRRTQQAVWGLLPLEWQTSVRVALTDELWIQSDLVLFRGAQNIESFQKETKVKGAADLNAALSYRLSRSLQLWARFNNLFDQPYQRWNRNPVFGFNCSGGIVFSLDDKKKP